MVAAARLLYACFISAVGIVLIGSPLDAAEPKKGCWKVAEIRAGMKGQGLTVIKGTKIESFSAEVLGVLRNTSPGRDMVLCRLSGLNLDKTGVIAGMSGSPIYIDNKLVGAVAYAWQFGKEPIAGVTPFCQMHGYVAAYEKRDLADKAKPRRIGLRKPLKIDGGQVGSVIVSDDYDTPRSTAANGVWLTPLRTPLAATGMTKHSLSLLGSHLGGFGITPVQGGAVAANISKREWNTPLEPGSALTVSMITGDFDLSGIGTVTHVEGKRVYGWGHPFMGLGECKFPLMTGYVHTIMPLQSLSFKVGSPIRQVGIVNADVSTCVAGWLDRKADMMPVEVTVRRHSGKRTFKVRVARTPALLGSLVYAALTNSVDMEGQLPDELTAHLNIRLELQGRDPIVIRDTFSGTSYAGRRAPPALFSPVNMLISRLSYNSFGPVRIERVICDVELVPGRRTAQVESVRLASSTYKPGDKVDATIFLRPHKGGRQRVNMSLRLPKDLPKGTYRVTFSDDITSARQNVHDNPTLRNPRTLDQLLDSLKVQTSVKRTCLTARMATKDIGVAVEGEALPNLPASMVQILGSGRRTGAEKIKGAVISRAATDWVIEGMESVSFKVTK